jgi:ribosomal protein S18 acetylase RimI-like enzyme
VDNVTLREAQESDFPFIYSTWLKGLRFGNETFEKIHQDTYFKQYHKILEQILTKPETYIVVACLPDDPSTILGYSVREGEDTLHYVHVKQAFRQFGIAKTLCPENLRRVTHVTNVGWSILKKKFPNAVFNPFWS